MPDGKVKIEIRGPGAFLLFSNNPLINEKDLLFAAERQKARIIDRTAKGLDFEGKAFAPYKDTGRPYYYYAQSGGSANARIRAATRLHGTLGRSYGATLTKSRKGIKFPNYAAFKRWLGRKGSTVDLTGPRAPHMMQSLVATVKPTGLGMFRIVIGIYDEEKARIAEGHNKGVPGRLPKREFMGFSREDVKEIRSDVIDHILARWATLGMGG